jgi:hypothetical protein
MKMNRLSLLIVAMLSIAFLRFALSAREAEIAAVEPTVRMSASVASVAASVSGGMAEPANDADRDAPGNAFAVRVVAAPDAAPPQPVALPPPVAGALQPALDPAPPPSPPPAPSPPPPPPPFAVIGTYADGAASAVFLAAPSGTLIARPGSVLLAEYRVTGITAQHVTLIDESTQRTFRIPVPGSAAP